MQTLRPARDAQRMDCRTLLDAAMLRSAGAKARLEARHHMGGRGRVDERRDQRRLRLTLR